MWWWPKELFYNEDHHFFLPLLKCPFTTAPWVWFTVHNAPPLVFEGPPNHLPVSKWDHPEHFIAVHVLQAKLIDLFFTFWMMVPLHMYYWLSNCWPSIKSVLLKMLEKDSAYWILASESPPHKINCTFCICGLFEEEYMSCITMCGHHLSHQLLILIVTSYMLWIVKGLGFHIQRSYFLPHSLCNLKITKRSTIHCVKRTASSPPVYLHRVPLNNICLL